jgi:hypothetical protein
MRVAVCLLALGLLTGVFARPAQAEVSFSFFYSNLSPHGAWQVSAEYGRVWQPSVYAPGWNPYYDGHWVYTDVGWAWVSDYAWGAIPYHYGTWVADPYLGWVWVPGYVWAPSWVVFRTGPDYVGWCPVPVHYSIGASLHFNHLDAGHFVFVPAHDFLAPRIRYHAVPRGRTNVVYAGTRIVNNIRIRNDVVVNPGPDVEYVGKARGRRVDAVPIERVARAAPGGRASREVVRVGESAHRRGLRATEPRSVAVPVSSPRRGREPGDGREWGEPQRSRGRVEPDRSSSVSRQGPARRESAAPPPRAERRMEPQARPATPKGKPARPNQGPPSEGKAKNSAEKKPPKNEPRGSGGSR